MRLGAEFSGRKAIAERAISPKVAMGLGFQAMKASIIVPTLNRSISLRKTLSSITLQTFPAEQFEIIVVDNGSADGTRETIEAVIESHPRYQIRYVYEPERGLLAGRHRGVLEAIGELLIFIDDDIEADSGWLRAIVSGFDDVKVQLIGGRNLPRYEVDPPAWIESFWDTTGQGGRLCWFLSLTDLGEKKLHIKPSCIWGLNFSIRRHAFYDLGGFHPDSVPEHLQHFDGDGESGLAMAAEARGTLALYEPAAIVYHFIPASRMTLNILRGEHSYKAFAIHILKLDAIEGQVSRFWRKYGA